MTVPADDGETGRDGWKKRMCEGGIIIFSVKIACRDDPASLKFY